MRCRAKSRSWPAAVLALVLTASAPCVAQQAAPQPAAAAADADKLPLDRVVMFNSGVAFYEHEGHVEGNAQVDLRFNVKDVNDLLKSMVLRDYDKGQVSTITYPSREPLTRTLSTFAIDLTGNPTLADLLGQVRGEEVELSTPQIVRGTILGIERKPQRVGDEVITSPFLNLLTEGGLRSINLDSVQQVKLTNAKLDAELRQALLILALGHSTDQKTVSLNFQGQGKRRVSVGYIQEAPVWKTSYRLVLKDNEKPYLQGWAIVENTTEQDWKEVGLTLVSGRPISFRMDLYQPLFVQRPLVEPELFASLRPQTYGQDLANAEQDFKAAANKRQLQGGAGFFGGEEQLARNREADGLAKAEKPRSAAQAFSLKDAGVQSMAQTGEVGELFQYTIDTPVTLPRRQSAMLPIVNESVTGEKVSIYNPAVQAKHPLNGLRMVNSTGLHLLQGPITVFDGAVYAGDARIQDLAPGTTRLLSYALDLDCEVAPEGSNQPEELLSVRLQYGNLYATTKYRRTQNYKIKNSGTREKKVLIERPLQEPWKLVSPKEEEKTRDMLRFAVQAKPGVPTDLKVEEEHTAGTTIALNNLDDNRIGIYLRATVVSADAKKALSELIERKRAISGLVQRRQQLEGDIKVIDVEQARIRQNMAQIDKGSDLYARYVKKFGEQETQVEALREDIKKVQQDEENLRKSLNEFLLKLNIT